MKLTLLFPFNFQRHDKRNEAKSQVNGSKKVVRFFDTATVHDHLSRDEMKEYDIFWTEEECINFEKEALHEMKKCSLKYCCKNINQILSLLHQPKELTSQHFKDMANIPTEDILEEIVREIENEAIGGRDKVSMTIESENVQSHSSISSRLPTMSFYLDLPNKYYMFNITGFMNFLLKNTANDFFE